MKLKLAIASASLLTLSSVSAGALPASKPAPAASFASMVNDTFTDAWAFNLGGESLVVGGMTAVGHVVLPAREGRTARIGEGMALPLPGTFIQVQTRPLVSLSVDDEAPTLPAGRASSEPETYAVLLAGLGAIGFLVRRRRLN